MAVRMKGARDTEPGIYYDLQRYYKVGVVANLLNYKKMIYNDTD